MTAMAVNCLVTEARRKLVWASILPRVRRSVIPYPCVNTALPFLSTSTAAPGESFDRRLAKIELICFSQTESAAKLNCDHAKTNPTDNQTAQFFTGTSP